MKTIPTVLAAVAMVFAQTALAQEDRFTKLAVPGALNTQPPGINDAGDIVGFYQDATGFHGYLNADRMFTVSRIAS
jgi:hypothetical protein